MEHLSSRSRKRFFKRSQSGQSLIILAIGFLALIGFVGIVTDVSLLFVRYSTLRRAVDAAAVAAAGQMRRIEGETDIGQDQAISFSNMNLAARQFIEFYGLNPSEVTVELCQAQNRDISSPTALRDPALCTSDLRKLVRVTAQIDSPTTFFSLFGFRTIRLQASSTSETAVLDLIFIMDVSESMLNETTPRTWGAEGYNIGYIPPVPVREGQAERYGTGPDLAQRQAQRNAWAALVGNSNNTILGNLNTLLAPLRADATERQIRTFNVVGATGTLGVRSECQVRFWPGSILRGELFNRQVIEDYITALGGMEAFLDWFNIGGNPTVDQLVSDPTYRPRWAGLVPMYDFYGCCNDPNGDWNMADLLCQPFQQARDASTDFMTRLDFNRGDRVGIITFDRRAYLIDPDPSDTDPTTPGQSDPRDAMIGTQQLAQDIMEQRVGVRTEGSFYVDQTRDGIWDGFYSGTTGVSWNYFNSTPVGSIIDQPANNACPLDNAVLTYPYSLLKSNDGSQFRTHSTYFTTTAPIVDWRGDVAALAEVATIPSWYESMLTTNIGAGDNWIRVGVQTDNANNQWDQSGAGYGYYDTLRRSYEYNASCSGTNQGDGLGLASQTLGRLGRREGAVWIMVLLSDGAANASSPAYRGNTVASVPFVYQAGANGGTNPSPGQYGGYGLCPYGENPTTNPTSPRINAYRNNVAPYPGEVLHDLNFPRCGDIQPYTRHFCPDASVPTAAADQANIGPVKIDLNDATSCVNYYDVDDYARDWADYVAVRGINVFRQTEPNPILRNNSDALLPTIFTIGFGLNFERTSCSNNNNGGLLGNPVLDCNYEDYLGEELLRYVADAGDNFRIDSDYWQYVMGYRIPNNVTDLAAGETAEWGQRGPCETESFTSGNRQAWSPLPIRQNCGNYWNARDQNALSEVFAEIASRMFTRLSG
jgi:Flp pilus assembly protein TadG